MESSHFLSWMLVTTSFLVDISSSLSQHLPSLQHCHRLRTIQGDVLSQNCLHEDQTSFGAYNACPLARVSMPYLEKWHTNLWSCTLQLIINVTEDPAARANLQFGIKILRTMILETMSGTLKKCARQTIQELQFQSRPFQNLKDVR